MSKHIKIVGGRKIYDEITFLRGFSILTIVMMHYLQNNALPGIIEKSLSIGGTGVHVFFFCSGFGLFLSHLRKPLNFRQFLRKRFLKIYLPYIIIVSVSALLPYMYEGNRLGAWLSHVFLYKMFIPKYEESFGPFWFISTLFQFYLIFLPLAKIKEKIGTKRWIIISLLISVIWWCFTTIAGIADLRIWGSFCFQYLWEFALGMAVAEYLYSENSMTIKIKWLPILGVFGIGMAGVAKIYGGFLTTFNDVFAVIGYGAIALMIYGINIKTVNKMINFISSISYEFYLLHIVVFLTLQQFVGNCYIVICSSLCISILLSILYKKINLSFIRKLVN